jgi:hypothetical protein
MPSPSGPVTPGLRTSPSLYSPTVAVTFHSAPISHHPFRHYHLCTLPAEMYYDYVTTMTPAPAHSNAIAPLEARTIVVHSGHLSEIEHDGVFWRGFHPEDRSKVQQCLLSKYPHQPPDVPFPFEDVFPSARAAFADDHIDTFPPSWLHEQHFRPPSVRCEQPADEPVHETPTDSE